MKKVLTIAILLTSFLSISYVYAQPAPPATNVTSPSPSAIGTPTKKPIPFLSNPIKVDNVQDALILAVDIAIVIGTIIAVLMFIWIGFQFVMAQGNPAKIEAAKKWFLYAAIGTAILLSSKVIVEVIKATFVSTGVVKESLFKKN